MSDLHVGKVVRLADAEPPKGSVCLDTQTRAWQRCVYSGNWERIGLDRPMRWEDILQTEPGRALMIAWLPDE